MLALSAAAQPPVSVPCLAVKNLRLALVLDLEWTNVHIQLRLMQLLFFFFLIVCKHIYRFMEETSHSSTVQKHFSLFTF